MEDDHLTYEDKLTTETLLELGLRLASGEITPDHIEEFVTEMTAGD
jgi:hypothetical protein